MNRMTGSHHNLLGMPNYRGVSIDVIDFRAAIKIITNEDKYEAEAVKVIITVYNQSVQEFRLGIHHQH